VLDSEGGKKEDSSESLWYWHWIHKTWCQTLQNKENEVQGVF